MTRSPVVAGVVGAVLGLFAACATTPPARPGLQASCRTDRDCTFGLVCVPERGGSDPNIRRCDYERYEACTQNEQCFPGRTCRSGWCTVECITDNDCLSLNDVRKAVHGDGGMPPEVRCVVGECRSSGGSDRTCTEVADCMPGEECTNGKCVNHASMRCMSDFDCEANERCISQMCR